MKHSSLFEPEVDHESEKDAPLDTADDPPVSSIDPEMAHDDPC